MILTVDERLAIERQAAEEYPRECCGVILIRGNERRLIRCRNVQDEWHARDPVAFPRDARTAYRMDARDLLMIHDLTERQGYRVHVIYHSHPDAGAYFSETDRRDALTLGEPNYPEATYVVVSVVGARPVALAAYRWDPGSRTFVRVPDPAAEPPGRRTSRALFAAAERVIPGGVNSPVRAFRAVGGEPFFVVEGRGGRLIDVEGREYIDLVGSWGPLILGHAAPAVVEAVRAAAARGTSYGTPTPGEVELAELIAAAFPSIEQVRLVSSGTEAAMSAIRLARGATGRDLIVKFEGGYHGHADSLLVRAGSGGATFSVPDSRGVPEALARLTVTLPFNDLDAVRGLFAERGQDVAAVIVEPVAGNMGVVAPAPGFLEGLREVTARAGAVLIFDEVITGFRLALGGAQERYGVRPDLTILGTVIGGGLPVGADGGRRDLMSHVAPLGGVYQAGTLAGNPLAVAAGLATLRILQAENPYPRLEALGGRLEQALLTAAAKTGVPVTVNRVGSMLTPFFTPGPVTDWASARASDTGRYARFFHAMLARGVYLAPSQFEAAFVSLAHTDADLAAVAAAAVEAMAAAR